MAERQRSLVEVDQRLNDLQTAPGCTASLLRPLLDPVVEAAVNEEMSATPLLRSQRGLVGGEVAIPVTNGDAGSGPPAAEALSPDKSLLACSVKTVQQGVEDGPASPDPPKPILKTPRSAENLFNTHLAGVQGLLNSAVVRQASSVIPGGSTGASPPPVSRMYSVPARTEAVQLPPRPLVMSGSLRGVQRAQGPPEVLQAPIGTRKTLPGGTARSSLFSYPGAAVASTSPWRSAALPQQQKANGSSDNLARGPSPAPATPRGSSMPPEARRIFPASAGQAGAASPSVSSPRGFDTLGSQGVLGSMTPRLPLQSVRASASGYGAGPLIAGAVGQQLDGATPRARSVSASPSQGAPVSSSAGPLSPRRVIATPFAQYGNRFSAVTPTHPGVSLQPSSRTNTPQPMSGCRFVPVSAYAEAQRGRESSQGPAVPGPSRASSVATRGASPLPGYPQAASATVVRQSSVARPPSGGAVRQVSVSSSTTAPGASVTTMGAPGGVSCVASAAEEPQLGAHLSAGTARQQPPHVAVAVAAAAAAARSVQGNPRHSLGAPGTSTPQPSRYAYANSAVRRDCAPNPRDVRRYRGRA